MAGEPEEKEAETIVPLPKGCTAALLDGAWSCARCGTARPMDSEPPGCTPMSIGRLVSIAEAARDRAYDEYQTLHRVKTSPQTDPVIAVGTNPWPVGQHAAELGGVALFLERCARGDQRVIEALQAIQKKAAEGR